MGVCSIDMGPLERNGGRCIATLLELDDNDAGPARVIGGFKWPPAARSHHGQGPQSR